MPYEFLQLCQNSFSHKLLWLFEKRLQMEGKKKGNYYSNIMVIPRRIEVFEWVVGISACKTARIAIWTSQLPTGTRLTGGLRCPLDIF